MIDIYCERQGPGLFAEPINTITNISFIFAAVFAFSLARRRNVLSPNISVLIILAAMVGLGSAIWHMFATSWANLMDLIPILLFQLWFFWLYLRDVLRITVLLSALIIVSYTVICVSMMYLPPYFNGSILYAPALAAIISLGVIHYVRHEPGRRLLIIGSVLFCVALLFRTIDEMFCSHIPFGTHFLWHVFNGILLYVAMRVIILKHIQEKAH